MIRLTRVQAQEGTDSNAPSHAPTPTASHAPSLSGAAQGAGTNKPGNKKKRPPKEEDEEDLKAPKRPKISFGRGE